MRSRPAWRRWSAGGPAPSPGRWSACVSGAWPALVTLALLAAGCAPAGAPRHAPAPPAARAPLAGYDTTARAIDVAGWDALAGRRIALDPGHGGWFRGALGVGGLTEAEVNLGVALHLASLLRAAGAEVLLTRETDRDFLSPADSSLRSDLAARVAMVNAWHPDAFVSIHHNADPGARHDVNETQVYHQLGDDGPALEMAEDVHRSLTRHLGIEVSRLIPGNFYVVRGSEAPALLTEASHITYPPTEARLATRAAQQLEAAALAAGLARWFARERPEVEGLRIVGAPDDSVAPVRIAHGRPTFEAGVRGAFDQLELRLDGERLEPEVTRRRVRATVREPLAAGAHTVTLRARLAGEGTGRTEHLAFVVDKPAARLAADFPMQSGWRAGEPVGVRVRALDAEGVALPAGARIRVRAADTPADTLIELRDGEAWAYLTVPAVTRGTMRVSLALESGSTGRGITQVATLPRAAANRARHTTFLRVQPADTLWRGRVPESARAWLGRDGFVAADAAPGTWRRPSLAGYRSVTFDSQWPPQVVAIADGVLHGRRIALDAEGGGDDPAGVGPSGTRASALSLQVARALEAMLRAAGAEVLLVRTSEAPVSEVSRVQLAEGFGAERYLRIAHRAAAPSAGHYFSSGGGRRWARALAALAPRLGLDSLMVTESARYPIAQVSAVALDASLARVDRDEARLLAPGAVRAEAYTLYAALVSDLLGRELEILPIRVLDATGRPRPHAFGLIDGAFLLQADAGGEVRVVRTETSLPILEALDPPR